MFWFQDEGQIIGSLDWDKTLGNSELHLDIKYTIICGSHKAHNNSRYFLRKKPSPKRKKRKKK